MTILERISARLGPRGITTDQADTAPWLTDWRGRVTGAALAMVSPADAAEVAFVIREAAAARVPIVPQGGNTSMVAGAVPGADGGALLLSLRRMAAVRRVSDGLMVAEAGAILSHVHEAAAATGQRFPLSLAARGSATVGGLVSTNAGGTQVLRFGTMRRLVAGVEAVLPDGQLFDGLAPLAKDNRGYDLTGLLVGAEGTLGIVTTASLRLVPAVAARSVAWVGVAAPEDALRLLRFLEARTGDAVEAFEIVPDTSLRLVLQHLDGARAPLGGSHRWHLLIEATAPAGGTLPPLAELLAESGLAEDATVAATEAQADALWRLREGIAQAERREGMAAKHDVSVPVEAMPRFIEQAAERVTARFPGVRVNAFGHLGDGNVHFNVMPPAGADDRAWFAASAADVTRFVHDLVAAEGGSLSAEHGIGQLKLDEFARLGGSARLSALRAIKRALDPHGIMNPGKLVPPEEHASDPARDRPSDAARDMLAEDGGAA